MQKLKPHSLLDSLCLHKLSGTMPYIILTPYTSHHQFLLKLGVELEVPTTPPTVPPTTIATTQPLPTSTQLPSTGPPSTQTPTTEARSTETPERPSTEPVSTSPPPTDPPSTEPLSSEPPSTLPPTTEPPASDALTTESTSAPPPTVPLNPPVVVPSGLTALIPPESVDEILLYWRVRTCLVLCVKFKNSQHKLTVTHAEFYQSWHKFRYMAMTWEYSYENIDLI